MFYSLSPISWNHTNYEINIIPYLMKVHLIYLLHKCLLSFSHISGKFQTLKIKQWTRKTALLLSWGLQSSVHKQTPSKQICKLLMTHTKWQEENKSKWSDREKQGDTLTFGTQEKPLLGDEVQRGNWAMNKPCKHLEKEHFRQRKEMMQSLQNTTNSGNWQRLLWLKLKDNRTISV